jgi:hypothetical protein
VAVIILVWVSGGDGLSPGGSALELLVVNVDTGVDDKDCDAIASIGVVLVLVEGTEGEGLAVGDTGKTPGGTALGIGGIDDLITLNVIDLCVA